MKLCRDVETPAFESFDEPEVSGTCYQMELELSTGEKDRVLVDEKRDLTDRVVERVHERVLLSNGGHVDFQRFTVETDMSITAGSLSGKRLVVVMVALEGTFTMTCPEDGSELEYSCVQGHAFVHNGRETTFRIAAGQNLKVLGLSLTPEIFERYFDYDVPKALQPLLMSNVDDAVSVAFPVSSVMRETLLQNLNIDTGQSLQQIKMEGIGLLYLALIGQSLREDAKISVNRMDVDKARRAYLILQDNLQEPPCLSDLAEMLYITEKRLNQAFREIYSDTVFEVLRGFRLEKAKMLLESTDMAIKEIAWEVGYNHSTNFSTAFNQKYGIPPAEYARKVRSGVVQLLRNL